MNNFSPWKWLYLISAAASVFWSIFLLYALPTSQATARFLTDEEKVAAVEMVRENNTGIHNRTFHKGQLKEALVDPKSYIFFCFAFFGNLPNSVSTVSVLSILRRFLPLTLIPGSTVWKSCYFELRVYSTHDYFGQLHFP